MEMKQVIQITTNGNIEEQYILEKFPEAFWIPFHGGTNFFLPWSEGEKTKLKALY